MYNLGLLEESMPDLRLIKRNRLGILKEKVTKILREPKSTINIYNKRLQSYTKTAETERRHFRNSEKSMVQPLWKNVMSASPRKRV